MGNNIVESTTFNPRLQPQTITAGALMTLTFGYGTTDNNGNVVQQEISRPGVLTATQHYRYDGVNRLAIAAENAQPAAGDGCPAGAVWCRDYSYDAYGNRWVQSANHTLSFATPTAQSQFDAATNRLAKTFDGTPLPADAYDPAGNLAKHAWVGAMAYDANNLQRYYCTSATATCTAANANAEYQYDGDGRRVKNLQASRTTVFVYDAFGNLAAEYDTQPDPNLAAGAYYRTTDHLGSTRLVTNATGAVVSRRDFFPFGEEIPANTPGATPQGQISGDERQQPGRRRTVGRARRRSPRGPGRCVRACPINRGLRWSASSGSRKAIPGKAASLPTSCWLGGTPKSAAAST